MIAVMAWLVAAATARPVDALRTYLDALDEAVVDRYADGDAAAGSVAPPDELVSAIDPTLAASIKAAAAGGGDVCARVGTIRGRLQQAVTLKMADAVRSGDLAAARAWRVELTLPRGVSATEGALFLDTLANAPDKRPDGVKLLTREAITWQTTRVRQLLADAAKGVREPLPMPNRLREQLAEATALAALPVPLADAAGLSNYRPADAATRDAGVAAVVATEWPKIAAAYAPLRQAIESSLPSLLSDSERARRERLLLKLVMLIPREYSAGVREGKVTVPLEFRESVAFTAQSRQLLGELAPLWLADSDAKRDALGRLENHLALADDRIAKKSPAGDVAASLKGAQGVLESDLGVTLARSGTTADIVEEVMLETRTLLGQSLAAALAGDWREAEQRRLEAYTTYDPELEARLMPRDPQLATDIEHLLLDGLSEPGVKVLLDARAPQADLEAAYARVNEGLNRATAQLKSGVSPSAAAVNAASVVLREGLEGLLVIIAIFAGLRGAENARRRRLFWAGVIGSVVVTGLTWVLSQTILTSLRSHGETIAAVTGLVAIGTLLLITNWLFQQVYWKQWITTLKAQAVEGESVWALMTAGFAVGYREGLETVLFLQSLVLDAGGTPVAAGVAVGGLLLLALGVLSLYVGMKLPYFKLLLVTAALIGLVLVTFTGGTVRALQTVGWLPVHRFTPGSWPVWTGNWLGLYNTWESMTGQGLAVGTVLGTWAVARWSAKRKSTRRRAEMAAGKLAARTEATATEATAARGPDACDPLAPSPSPAVTVSPAVRREPTVRVPASAAR